MLYMSKNEGFFISDEKLIDQAQEELNRLMIKGEYDNMRLSTILKEIDDKIEKETGKRPVHISWRISEQDVEGTITFKNFLKNDDRIVLDWTL